VGGLAGDVVPTNLDDLVIATSDCSSVMGTHDSQSRCYPRTVLSPRSPEV
jgi:hypothetical protein